MAIANEDRGLAAILVKNSYLHRRKDEEPFVLTSGRTSYHYFDCKRTTCLAEALPLIARAFWARLDPKTVAVGGLTRGADPIADAIAYFSAASGGRPVDTFSVRKEQKAHGTEPWVDGRCKPGECVTIVDDVITTGKSSILAIDRCQEAGVEIQQVIVLVDRQEGGLEAIEKRVRETVNVQAIFTKEDLDGVWGEREKEEAGR
jgi:orotate phosphoribosyltransferase